MVKLQGVTCLDRDFGHEAEDMAGHCDYSVFSERRRGHCAIDEFGAGPTSTGTGNDHGTGNTSLADDTTVRFYQKAGMTWIRT